MSGCRTEDVLSAHPAVSAVAVIGIPDERWGEAMRAVLVTKPGCDIVEDELLALVRDAKGPVYAPKSIDVVDSMPMTPVGKTDKVAPSERYWVGQERRVG